MELITFDRGAEQTVADVSPAEVDAEDGEGDGQETGGESSESALESFLLGIDNTEGCDGEANEEGEGGAGEEEARGVVAEICCRPGEGEGAG